MASLEIDLSNISRLYRGDIELENGVFNPGWFELNTD
jgi:hypothetical protein